MRRIRRQLLGISCAALSALLLSGCFSKKEEAAVSVVEDGVLTVGIIDGQDRYASKGDDGYSGIEPEILNSLAKDLGVQIEYVDVPEEKQLMEQLDEGKIDVAAGRLGELEAYRENHLISDPYARNGLYLVMASDLYVDSLVTFAEKSVGVSALTPENARLEIPHVEDVTLVDYETPLVGLMVAIDLSDHVIEALICTEREALVMAEGGLRAAEIYDGPRAAEVFYMAPGQTEVMNQLNVAIGQYLDRQ